VERVPAGAVAGELAERCGAAAPCVLLGFEDAVINLPDDDEPEEAET